MNEPLDELYLEWLYSQVGSLKTKLPSRTYWSLLRQLFKTEFVWFVPNDDNRAEDGKELRIEFIREVRAFDIDPDWIAMECSVLEMIMALTRRLAFESEGEPRWWFWHLLENLELTDYNDKNYDDDAEIHIKEVTDRVVNRTYNRDGLGGLFPLDYPGRDQRKVELWYQLSAYILEREEG